MIALFVGKHIKVQGRHILHIEVGFLVAVPEVDDFHVAFAGIADIHPVALIAVHGKIGELLLLFVAAEGAFYPAELPLGPALVAEQEFPALFLFE